MSNYSLILSEFIKLGIKEDSKLSQYQLNSALDKIIKTNLNLMEFDRGVSQQLYQQTQKQYGGSVIVKNYIRVIVSAQTVLEKHIKNCQEQLKFDSSQATKTANILSLKQFSQDYKLLTTAFNISSHLNHLQLPNYPSNRVHNDLAENGIFYEQAYNRRESVRLQIVLIIVLVSILIEMLLMFVKHHFLSLLVYIAIFGIFILNYFDKQYIKTCLILIAISLGFDLLWVITEADPYWNRVGLNQHSHIQPTFLRFIFIMTILMMIVKGFLTFMIWKYKDNNQEVHKMVKLFRFAFQLDGRAKQNPLHYLWLGIKPSHQVY